MAQVGALLQRSGDSPTSGSACRRRPATSTSAARGWRVTSSARSSATSRPTAARRRSRSATGSSAKGSSTRCELTLVRDRKAEPVRTTLAFKTMEGLPLPARVLDVFFDTADWLGPDARVEGALTLRQTGAKDWEADFQGDLLDVDLGVLVGRRFPGHGLERPGPAGARLGAVGRPARPGLRLGRGPGRADQRPGDDRGRPAPRPGHGDEVPLRPQARPARRPQVRHRLPRPGLHLRDDPRRRDPDRRRPRQRVRPRRRAGRRRPARWPTPPRARPTSAA